MDEEADSTAVASPRCCWRWMAASVERTAGRPILLNEAILEQKGWINVYESRRLNAKVGEQSPMLRYQTETQTLQMVLCIYLDNLLKLCKALATSMQSLHPKLGPECCQMQRERASFCDSPRYIVLPLNTRIPSISRQTGG
jgi:hypothetical protein